MTTRLLAALMFALIFAPLAAQAQMSETTPASEPRMAPEALPTNGLSMDQVLSRFGEPEQRVAPVGDPPIARWDYRDYSVYFEYDTVLHSVVHR